MPGTKTTPVHTPDPRLRSLFARFPKGPSYRPSSEFDRLQDDLCVGAAKLLHITALDALELDGQRAIFRPLAVSVERDVANDCLDNVPVQPVGELRLIEPTGRRNRLRQGLHSCICEGWTEVT